MPKMEETMSHFTMRIFRLYWVVLLVLFASGCSVKTNRLFTQDDLPRLVLQPSEVSVRFVPINQDWSDDYIGENRPTAYYGYIYVQSQPESSLQIVQIYSSALLYLDETDAANELKPLVKKLLADAQSEELSVSKIDGLGEEA
jgi:hypothetical protein